MFTEQGVISSWTFFWLVGGEVTGIQHHWPSGFIWSGSMCLWAAYTFASSTWWKFQYLQNSSEDTTQNIIYSPWGATKGPWLCLMAKVLLVWVSQVVLSSVQFSRSVVSDSLRSHEPQHARPPCPSPTPRVHPKPCPLSHWCHPTISSSVVPLSSCPQSFPASGSFQISQLFASGGPSIGVSASTSVLPMNTQDWSPLGWTGWSPSNSLQSKGLSRVFSNTTVQKHQFYGAQLSL